MKSVYTLGLRSIRFIIVTYALYDRLFIILCVERAGPVHLIYSVAATTLPLAYTVC